MTVSNICAERVDTVLIQRRSLCYKDHVRAGGRREGVGAEVVVWEDCNFLKGGGRRSLYHEVVLKLRVRIETLSDRGVSPAQNDEGERRVAVPCRRFKAVGVGRSFRQSPAGWCFSRFGERSHILQRIALCRGQDL